MLIRHAFVAYARLTAEVAMRHAWLLTLLICCDIPAADFFVAADGSPQGTGERSHPWDLATAFAAPAAVRPGDTIWLRGGTYRGGFVAMLAGTPNNPIVVRGEPSSRVTIDTNPRDEKDGGLLSLQGSDTIYRDFEVTCSHPLRQTAIAGSWPADIRRGSVDIRGDRISAINLVVHDCANGFGLWSLGEGGEIYGCIIYNNGWLGPDRGHGHAIYAQNARGTKRMRDNLLFHQFAYGIHAYGSEKASLKGFEIEGNIAFHNGSLAGPNANSPGIMVGGGTPVERLTVRDNVVVGGGMRFGYTWGSGNEDLVCTGNYSEGLIVRDFRRAIVRHNQFAVSSTVVSLETADKLQTSGLEWDDNDYYVSNGQWGECSIVEGKKSRGLTFKQWQTETGLDKTSRFTKGTPDAPRVFVRPNAYEAGRVHLAVVNPTSLPQVEVDLTSVLKMDQAFRIVSAKGFYGQPIVSGKFDGRPIKLPMRPVQGPPPVGMPDFKYPVTEPRFAAFVVLP